MTGSTSARPTPSGSKTYPNAAGEAESTQWRTRTEREPLDPALDQRIEPRLGDPGVPPAASTAYEKLHGLGPDFGEYRSPPRSRVRRLAMMACVFIVGAGAGLAGAWWLHRTPAGAPVAAVSPSAVRAAPALPIADGKHRPVIRGISPSELPYDGAPPPAADPAPAVAVVPPTPPAAAETTSGASEIEQSGASGSEDSSASAGVRAEEKEEPPAAKAEVPVKAPPTKAAQEPRESDEDDTTKSAKAVKQNGASVASAAPKRKSAQRTDREIERIRRQVDEELKKKTEQGRGPGEARTGAGKGGRVEDDSGRSVSAGAPVSRVAATKAMLTKCDRNTNFIRRELCRWQVCNGSWGQNGCPSYQKKAPSY